MKSPTFAHRLINQHYCKINKKKIIISFLKEKKFINVNGIRCLSAVCLNCGKVFYLPKGE